MQRVLSGLLVFASALCGACESEGPYCDSLTGVVCPGGDLLRSYGVSIVEDGSGTPELMLVPMCEPASFQVSCYPIPVAPVGLLEVNTPVECAPGGAPTCAAGHAPVCLRVPCDGEVYTSANPPPGYE